MFDWKSVKRSGIRPATRLWKLTNEIVGGWPVGCGRRKLHPSAILERGSLPNVPSVLDRTGPGPHQTLLPTGQAPRHDWDRCARLQLPTTNTCGPLHPLLRHCGRGEISVVRALPAAAGGGLTRHPGRVLHGADGRCIVLHSKLRSYSPLACRKGALS